MLSRYVLTLALLCSFPSETVTAQPQSIGVIIPLTGAYANFGEAARTGFELALDRASRTRLRPIYEDSQYDAARAVSAFTKIMALDSVSAVLVLGSPPSSAVIPLAEKRNIAVFAWTPSIRLTAGTARVVRLMTVATDQGALMAREARARAYDGVAFFAAQNEFSESVRNAFLDSFGRADVVLSEEFPPGETDFRVSLSRARMRGAHSIGVCLNTNQIPSFLDQIKQLNFNAPIFGCHALSSPAVLRSLAGASLTAWFVEGRVSREFTEKFEKVSPDSSGLWVAAAFHDIAVLLASVSLDTNFIPNLIDRPIERSAFGRSRIKRGTVDLYLDVELDITRMENGRFIRTHSTAHGDN